MTHNTKKSKLVPIATRSLLGVAIASALHAPVALSQDASANDNVEVIEVHGIVSSLKRAMSDKKENMAVSDGIAAEDLGKFPDLNVAESLQRITGVSIDRSGGEGQQVTVRGFGPQFNTVLVNGRQLASDADGRAFNFDVLAADQITGANIYKSAVANMQSGGIGSTINVSTARPFDYDGMQIVGSVKGMYEDLSEETSPQASFLVSNTFADDKFGVLLAVSHQERQVQINRIQTGGWRPGLTLSNRNDGILADNVYFPRNWDQIVDQQDRTRTNVSLVAQFAPSDDITITLDGYVSKFEVDSQVTDLASWFEPDRVGSATVNADTGTAIQFTQEIDLHQGSGDPASDFVSHTRNQRDVTNDGFGLNVAWNITDYLIGNFDVSHSTAENDIAGDARFNVVGIINNYEFDSTGSIPTVIHDGFANGTLPDISLNRLHYNELGNPRASEDEITEYKADFTYYSDADVFQKADFGVLYSEREKYSYQEFASQCAFCGYNVEAPVDALNIRPFTANNYFSGLIDTWYTYDGDAYIDYLASQGAPINPTLAPNHYTVEEEVLALYAQFEFGYDLGDMPLNINIGARYEETDVSVSAVQAFLVDIVPTTDLTLFQNVAGPEENITGTSSYSNLLPSINVKLELEEDMILRLSRYDSLSRPTMSQMSPATTFGEPRRQNLTASGGNPALKPFEAENWDLSFEWYYSDDSIFSFAVFSKEVENFIVTLSGDESYTLSARTAADGFRCTAADCAIGVSLDPANPDVDVVATTEELNGASEVFTVTRPQNGETATVTGYEVAVTHVWDNGFGITANATVVNSDAEVSGDTTQTFALEGLGDSQNLIMFYEKDAFQARVAFNNRESFLFALDNTSVGGATGEPVTTKTYGQWDVSASYDINENFTVFVEGINVTGEKLTQIGRFNDQIYSIEDNGSRFAVGVRATF
ncbi:TonB-dependent receptor [Alteromonas sp. 14N.309.X.WAT.G.H12]|uniref:TonB-dependent receptor n=1 Tax=Alteromonas sp. 14N.309.X.WAT.G.H12 TaxID=3120824 RepID=UPI003A598A64